MYAGNIGKQILENQIREQEFNCDMQLKTDLGINMLETVEASRTRSGLLMYTDLGMIYELD